MAFAYRKWLEPLLDDESLHQVGQNLPALGPTPRLPGVERDRLVLQLAERLRLRYSQTLQLVSGRFVHLLRLVLRQGEVSRVGGLGGRQGRRVLRRGGDEGRGRGRLRGEAGQRWVEGRRGQELVTLPTCPLTSRSPGDPNRLI